MPAKPCAQSPRRSARNAADAAAQLTAAHEGSALDAAAEEALFEVLTLSKQMSRRAARLT